MRKILRLQKYQMTTHNLSFNISKDMSAFNIQLSFKLNIEPPENMYTFNIQPSLKLNVEPQENNSILQPIREVDDIPIKLKINLKVQDEMKEENKKCQEQNDTPKDIVNIQDKVKDTQSCNCLTHGQKTCLNDFKCQSCDICLYWKGYEEDTIFCGECYVQNKSKMNLTIDKCLENSELSPTTCKTYKGKIKDMIGWV